MRDVDRLVRQIRNTQFDSSTKSVSLTVAQSQRVWDKARVPIHQNMQFCIEYSHQSLKNPWEIDEVVQHNCQLEEDYKKYVSCGINMKVILRRMVQQEN